MSGLSSVVDDPFGWLARTILLDLHVLRMLLLGWLPGAIVVEAILTALAIAAAELVHRRNRRSPETVSATDTCGAEQAHSYDGEGASDGLAT